MHRSPAFSTGPARRRWQGPVLALPRTPAPLPLGAAGEDTAPVRDAMQELLAGLAGSPAARLRREVREAAGLAALWQLRGPMLQVLARRDGELAALRQIMRVDGCFPAGWIDVPVSRPGTIG